MSWILYTETLLLLIKKMAECDTSKMNLLFIFVENCMCSVNGSQALDMLDISKHAVFFLVHC